MAQVERRIFLLLAVLYPDADMEQIYAGIHDASATDAPRRRGNAVELLDNLLDRALKKRFLPLLEEHSPRRAAEAGGAAVYPAAQAGDPEVLLRPVQRRDGLGARLRPLVRLASRARPSRRRTLLATASATRTRSCARSRWSRSSAAPRAQAAELAENRLRDEAPFVRQQAALITARRRRRLQTGG